MLRNNSTYVWEDCDDCETIRANEKGRKEGLSIILNCVDGIKRLRNVVFIYTTNHREQLDDALLREGRMDKQYDLPLVNDELLEKFNNKYKMSLGREYIDKPICALFGAERERSLSKKCETVSNETIEAANCLTRDSSSYGLRSCVAASGTS